MSASHEQGLHRLPKRTNYRNKSYRQFRDGEPRLLRYRKPQARPLPSRWAAVATILFAAFLAAAAYFN